MTGDRSTTTATPQHRHRGFPVRCPRGRQLPPLPVILRASGGSVRRAGGRLRQLGEHRCGAWPPRRVDAERTSRKPRRVIPGCRRTGGW
ncbi:hypothetical protein QJS66_21525 [Kocuria rhizophila]|nr:hypothetical protein QJS66_21525 [Kocuria rhizophila]